jgi:SAM-dependent MidA family methyltransferase
MPADAVPFREWMRRALYDPDRGYYAREIRTVGRRGDFSTSATISSVLGEAIASWVREKSKQHRKPPIFNLIEIGGGNGDLARAVRKSLGWFSKFHLHIVETSNTLREVQKKALGKRFMWHTDIREAFKFCGGEAFIYHNELLDAFPVDLVEWNAERAVWEEIWLSKSTERWSEERRPLSMAAEDQIACQALSWKPRANAQRAELGTAAHAWMREWAPHWKAGAMLTIDYGDEFPGMYHRRPRGTLRAYQAHQLFTGPEIYDSMGRRDLTADVNFSDLRRWGEALGWHNAPLKTQRGFLQKYLRKFDRRIQEDRALAFLADEHGAGTEFKVLEQSPSGRTAEGRICTLPQAVLAEPPPPTHSPS